MDYVKLGTILRDGRKAKDYTQQFVAGLVGVTPQNISSWERGKSHMDIDRYIQLCRLYDLDIVQTMMFCSPEINLPHFPVYYEECLPSAMTITVTEEEHALLNDYRSGKMQTRDLSMYIEDAADKRLKCIVECYDGMDDIGKTGLADQAEFLLKQHPRHKSVSGTA